MTLLSILTSRSQVYHIESCLSTYSRLWGYCTVESKQNCNRRLQLSMFDKLWKTWSICSQFWCPYWRFCRMQWWECEAAKSSYTAPLAINHESDWVVSICKDNCALDICILVVCDMLLHIHTWCVWLLWALQLADTVTRQGHLWHRQTYKLQLYILRKHHSVHKTLTKLNEQLANIGVVFLKLQSIPKINQSTKLTCIQTVHPRQD